MKFSSECGQALTEWIVFSPVFFLILSACFYLFSQFYRNTADEDVLGALNSSAQLFSTEERQDWDTPKEEASFEKEAYAALHASQPFHPVRSHDDIYNEKKEIPFSKESVCQEKDFFSVLKKEKGEFQWDTCAGKSAYETTFYDFGSPLQKMDSILHHFVSRSLYFPQNDFSWEERSREGARDVKNFMLSPFGAGFSQEIASLSFPKDLSKFNGTCLMEPFHPSCPLHPIGAKFERAAKDGANVQVFGCFTEMSGKCARFGGEPEMILTCEAAGLASLVLSLKRGEMSSVCPHLNHIVGIRAKSANHVAQFVAERVQMEEWKKRQELL